MNFIDTMIAIAERGEKVTIERATSIYTNKFMYVRLDDGNWVQRELPPPVDNTQFTPLPVEVPQTKQAKKKDKSNE